MIQKRSATQYMKLLVFAHTPPPHHGQSYMVQLMLEGFGGNRRLGQAKGTGAANPAGANLGIECYHVNAQFSRSLEDIGSIHLSKFLLLGFYCLQAIWCRFRYGVTAFYYIPAPGKHSAIYRDWFVMCLCRPFFKHMVFHWHSSGLAQWLEMVVSAQLRSVTYRFLRQADLSIVLSDYGRADAEKLLPQRIRIVGNGIPDPCPDFRQRVLPLRQARFSVRRLLRAGQPVPADLRAAAGSEPELIKALFLAHCTKDKGLFEALAGALLAHRKLASLGAPVSLKLIVAGQFVQPAEEAQFKQMCAEAPPGAVEYIGFVSGADKQQLFEQSDLFCFPSHLESFGLVLVEAMAYGLPMVTTRCGAIPEVMPADYPGIIPPRAPEQVAEALLKAAEEQTFEKLRQHFEAHYTVEQYLKNLAAALRTVDAATPRSGEPASASPRNADPAVPRGLKSVLTAPVSPLS